MYVHVYTYIFRRIEKYWIKIDNLKIFDDLRAMYKSHGFIMFMLLLYTSFLYILFPKLMTWLEKPSHCSYLISRVLYEDYHNFFCFEHH